MPMKKFTVVVAMLVLIVIQPLEFITKTTVDAAMKSVTQVNLSQAGQVIDSITYNSIIVEAVYSNQSHSGSDTTYSCAAFVKKFYKEVYGIGVYNLNSPTSTPLVYDNKGSFNKTSKPQVGDIIRDNTRTHWAIVKNISGNTITVVQQNWKSGSRAWINCTIELGDKGFSYFTYSGRVADTTKLSSGSTDTLEPSNSSSNAIAPGAAAQGSIIPDTSVAGSITQDSLSPGNSTVVPAISADVLEGTYYLVHSSMGGFLQANDEDSNWTVQAKNFNNSNQQCVSIVNHGDNQYSLRFVSNQRFLSISDTKEVTTEDTMNQTFLLVQREQGGYSISPANDVNKVISIDNKVTNDGASDLILQDVSDSENEQWYLNFQEGATLPIIPEVSESKKTLYTDYKDYTPNIKNLTKNAVITYSSSKPGVATVDTQGVVRPVSKGSAIITININQQSITYKYQLPINVKKPYIKINTQENEIKAGVNTQLSAKAYGSDSSITWQVSDTSIAEIDKKSGTLTTKKKGEVSITAKNKAGFKASKKFIIK